tara:strand:+ start:490 stop:801 length:312 start_codon:yes stop_codon:yes gene_type:complete
MAAVYPRDLSAEQYEILGRAMHPSLIDEYVSEIFERRSDAPVQAVEDKIAIFENALSSLPYDEMRRRAYPNIGDQLDDLYRGGAFSDDMAATLKAVKDAHSKD